MSLLPRAALRPARPMRTFLAGCLLAAAAAAPTSAYAAGPASLPGVALPAASTPTPSCQPWQTMTHVPVGPTQSAGSAKASRVPSRAVCRNAPPTPMREPRWNPDTVVGGSRLAASGIVVDEPPGVPGPPSVGDVAYVLADMDSGAILAAKSPHAWLRPASTLKTLTALTLLPLVPPTQVVTATDDDVRAEGTRVGLVAGNPYPAGALFEAMLMVSANDAVYALTSAVGGYDRALALMNAKAAEVGAFDTVAVDPSGLDEEGQHSSAYDLALIGRAAMQRPDFRAYVAKRQATFPGGVEKSTGKKYPPFQIPNINPLLGRYPGAIGVKPGRTNRAQHTFIGAATRNGRTLIVSEMGSTTGSWKDTAALLDWGFAHADGVTPVGRLVAAGEATPPVEAAASAPAPEGAAAAARAALSGTPAPPDPRVTWAALRDDLKQAGPLGLLTGGLVALLALSLLLTSRHRRALRRRRARHTSPGRPQERRVSSS